MVAGSKRPSHSILPAFLSRAGASRLSELAANTLAGEILVGACLKECGLAARLQVSLTIRKALAELVSIQLAARASRLGIVATMPIGDELATAFEVNVAAEAATGRSCECIDQDNPEAPLLAARSAAT